MTPAAVAPAITPQLPETAWRLTQLLRAPWRYRITRGAGHLDRVVVRSSKAARREAVTERVPVHSVAVRARHADGRALVAVWWDGAATDDVFTWHVDEHDHPTTWPKRTTITVLLGALGDEQPVADQLDLFGEDLAA